MLAGEPGAGPVPEGEEEGAGLHCCLGLLWAGSGIWRERRGRKVCLSSGRGCGVPDRVRTGTFP